MSSSAPGQAYILDGSATRTYEIDCVAGQNSVMVRPFLVGGAILGAWTCGKEPAAWDLSFLPQIEPLTKTLNTWELRRPN